VNRSAHAMLDTRTRIMMGVAPRRLPAVTRFRVVQSFAEQRWSRPRRNRTAAPIRVHLASIGHPSSATALCASEQLSWIIAIPATPELLAAFDGLPRHALPRARLCFPHPLTRTGDNRSPLPQTGEYMKQF